MISFTPVHAASLVYPLKSISASNTKAALAPCLFLLGRGGNHLEKAPGLLADIIYMVNNPFIPKSENDIYKTSASLCIVLMLLNTHGLLRL